MLHGAAASSACVVEELRGQIFQRLPVSKADLKDSEIRARLQRLARNTAVIEQGNVDDNTALQKTVRGAQVVIYLGDFRYGLFQAAFTFVRAF